MSNVDSQPYHESVAPNAPEAVAHEAASTTDGESVEAAQPAETAPIPQTENAPEAVAHEPASTIEVEAVQQAEVSHQEADQQAPDEA